MTMKPFGLLFHAVVFGSKIGMQCTLKCSAVYVIVGRSTHPCDDHFGRIRMVCFYINLHSEYKKGHEKYSLSLPQCIRKTTENMHKLF